MQYIAPFLLLLPLLAPAQATKCITQRTALFREEVTVLVAEPTVREGPYQKLLTRKRQLLEEGQYAANRRVGIWTFYDREGQPEVVYDYTQKTLLLVNRKESAPSMAQLWEGDSLRYVVVDRAPVYLASSQQIYGLLAQEVRFPSHLARAGLKQLVVNVLVTVAPSGTSFRILPSHADAELIRSSRQAALRAFEGIDWLLALYQKHPVTATYLLQDITLTVSP
ncbi:hypothetical protein [uncultured Fibrella sp.]|uniref:hypothetical protein n=1 Tax=uncultured Fibrella sp. TaxID=1284596 RepID=UPI0035CA2749